MITGIKDLDIYILLNLSYRELIKVFQINRYTYLLSKNPDLWRSLLKRDFPLRSKYIYYRKYRDLSKNDPRKFYEMILNRKSKVISISSYNFSEEEINVLESDQSRIDILNRVVNKNLSYLPLLRGDIVKPCFFQDYRNVGKFVWDGEKILELGYNLDDYGNIPSSFQFPEFPLDHFHNSISHNQLIYISFTTYLEILRNADSDLINSSFRDPILDKGYNITANFNTAGFWYEYDEKEYEKNPMFLEYKKIRDNDSKIYL